MTKHTPNALNEWVKNALKASGMTQVRLAEELYNRKIITAPDKTIVNKMTLFRDVSANEMMAISDITGFELPNHGPATIEVPIISWISAGAMTRGDAVDASLGILQIASLEPGDWIALRVQGDSMDRISPPDSIIVINRSDKNLVPNGCYVISDETNNATYKRYRPGPPKRFEPVSTNPQHEPIFFDNSPLIVGRVRRTILEM